MSNAALGFMMLCFVFMGLACFDGFLGFFYLASFLVKEVMPSELHDEAFEDLHRKIDLPEPEDDDAIGFSIGLTTMGSGRIASSSGRPPQLSSRSGGSVRSATSGRSGVSGRSNTSGKSSKSATSKQSGTSSNNSQGSIDDEIAALLGNTSKRLDLTDVVDMDA